MTFCLFHWAVLQFHIDCAYLKWSLTSQYIFLNYVLIRKLSYIDINGFYVIGLYERWLLLLNYLLITVPLRPSFTWMIRFHWGIVICVCCNPGKAVGIQKIERKQRCTSYKRSKCGRNWKQMEKEPRGPGCQIKNERSQTFRRNKFLEGRGEQNRVW